MTVGEAMERAEELRPGSRVAARTRQRWLCEVDGMLRERFFRPSGADNREGVGRISHGTTDCGTTMSCWCRRPSTACTPTTCAP